MEESVFITPNSKRRKTEVNFTLCVICQEKKKDGTRNDVKDESIQKVIQTAKDRYQFGCDDQRFKNCIANMREQSVSELKESGVTWHSNCYKWFTMKSHIERLKVNAEKTIEDKYGNTAVYTPPGRPTQESPSTDTDGPRVLRSNETIYDKSLCIICHKINKDLELHNVQKIEVGKKMLEIAKCYPDGGGFLRRMNTIPNAEDAIANDVKYHRYCFTDALRKGDDKTQTKNKIYTTARIISDIEILNMVKESLIDENAVVTTNTINAHYKKLIMKNGLTSEELSPHYKKYLKTLILANIADVEFKSSCRKNEPERVCSTVTSDVALDIVVNNCSDSRSIEKMFDVAKSIRKELDGHENWNFTGEFDDFRHPTQLTMFMRWILLGPNSKAAIDKESPLNKNVEMVVQMIMQNTVSDRQANYTPSDDLTARGPYSKIETPLSVGLAVYVHKQTRSKKLVDFLCDLNLSVSSNKLYRIQQDIATAINEEVKANDGLYMPPSLNADVPKHFAIDNVDFGIDTPDGKKQLHGTAMVVYQEKSATKTVPVKIERTTSFVKKSSRPLYEVTYCPEPKRVNKIWMDASPSFVHENEVAVAAKSDLAFSMMKSVETLQLQIPTWSSYNSLLGTGLKETWIQTLPLLSGSPTDWSNLYTALKIVQGINTFSSPGKKTIVSMDMQLYAYCMQLQSDSAIHDQFVFRTGELHIVFAMIKSIGKYIDSSGLDQIFIEANIYGPATMEQIKGGKHMKRSVEAFMSMYTALFHLYVEQIMNENPMLEKEVREALIDAVNNIENFRSRESSQLIANHDLLQEFLDSKNFLEVQARFDSSLQNIGNFLRNFMKMVENLILFIRASREGNWKLHLASLDSFVKYFFAHDLHNYARYIPIYLAEMCSLEESEPEIWQYLDAGNFSIQKTKVPFTAIGADHALEQENRSMKVSGGIVGIGNNQAALDQYFLIAPHLKRIIQSFYNHLKISKDLKNRQHYQLTDSTNHRMFTNVVEIKKILISHDVNFEESTSLCNLTTKSVMPADAAEQFLNHDVQGQILYEKYKEENICGNKSPWEKQSKRKLPTFASFNKVVKVKIRDKMISLKEQSSLMTRLLITARKRPEVDLEKIIGTYEFSVVPRSILDNDGSLMIDTTKSVAMHQIEKVLKDKNEENLSIEENAAEQKVIIFDGMAVLNKIKLGTGIQNCNQLAERFLSILLSEPADEVRVAFDRYIEDSLKKTTRSKRQGKVGAPSTQYEIKGDTNLEKTSMKKLLSHEKTKQKLTSFLGRYIAKRLEAMNKQFAVSFSTSTITNIPSLDIELLDGHEHEEADTLIVLHAIDVAACNPFRKLIVSSPDTDVFLLLIHYQPKIPSDTHFLTGSADKKRLISVSNARESMPDRWSSLLGFHAFTGCDITSKFRGKSKLSCWRTFTKAPAQVLAAFRQLGNLEIDLSTISTGLEAFVCQLYNTKSTEDISKLRWKLYAQTQQASRLPPTKAALKYKIMRSHLACSIWKKSHTANPRQLNPENYGWQRSEDGHLTPQLSDNPPAPEAIMELCVCSCTAGCITNICGCRRNKLVCTDMCQCQQHGCKNDEEDVEEDVNPEWGCEEEENL